MINELTNSVLEKVLDIDEEISNELIKTFTKKLNRRSSEELLISIGKGHIKPRQLLKLKPKSRLSFFSRYKRPKKMHTIPLEIKDLQPGVAIHFSECCLPLPDEDIIGITSMDSGIIIHSLKCEELNNDILDKTKNYDTIIIDEAQFFQNLVEFVEVLLTKKKYIIVAGLNGCAKQKKFGFICDLIPLCNKITKLSAICTVCNDGTPGDFTKMKEGIICNNQIIIGANETFVAVCRKHL